MLPEHVCTLPLGSKAAMPVKSEDEILTQFTFRILTFTKNKNPENLKV